MQVVSICDNFPSVKSGQNPVTFSVSDMRDPRLYREVEDFFHRHSNRSFHKNNILVQARSQGFLIGLVRLCHEENRNILRSMEVKSEFRRQKIGTRLLDAFQQYVAAEKIDVIYSLPYAHLEKFYGQIGFRSLDEDDLPPFLKLRLEAYRRKRPEARFCAMIRSGAQAIT